MKQVYNVNGKTYNSMEEWMEAEKSDADSTNLIWDYQEYVNCKFVNGRMVYPDGSYGKGRCWYKGKCYEGIVEYRDNDLYVGGEFVKKM